MRGRDSRLIFIIIALAAVIAGAYVALYVAKLVGP